MEFKPYHSVWTNALATACQVGLFLIFLVSGLLASESLDKDSAAATLGLVGAVVFISLSVIYSQASAAYALSKVMPPPAVKIEWAVGFNDEKYETTIETVERQRASNEDVVVFSFLKIL